MAGSWSIDASGRRLLKPDGSAFFYMADTAWELFHRLSEAEAEEYLTTRLSQGFNTVQAVILGELHGLETPNANGDLPLIDLDPARPSEAYFAHVDRVVRRANELGLVMALLPTWGDKVVGARGDGPQIFTAPTAGPFGAYVGRRYRDADVIWVLGGDRPAQTDDHLQTWRAMAEGILSEDDRHLLTYHPQGGASSSRYVHNEPWLDFNMFQSGHNPVYPNIAEKVAADLALEPRKPTLDGEPCYENHPDMGGSWTPTGRRFNDHDVRRRAWQPVLAGACGHTYGCNEVWQMLRPGVASYSLGSLEWREALHLPGAAQMGVMRRLFESRPFQHLRPADDLVTRVDQNVYPEVTVAPAQDWWRPPGEVAAAIRPAAAMTEDGACAILYLPAGSPLKLDRSRLRASGGRLDTWWYDPRTGAAAHAGLIDAADTDGVLTPPRRGWDWVLLVEDPAAGFGMPGR